MEDTINIIVKRKYVRFQITGKSYIQKDAVKGKILNCESPYFGQTLTIKRTKDSMYLLSIYQGKEFLVYASVVSQVELSKIDKYL